MRQVRVLRQMQTDGLGHRVLLDLVFAALQNVGLVVNFATVNVLLGDCVEAIPLNEELVEAVGTRRSGDSVRLIRSAKLGLTVNCFRSVNAL